MKRIQNRIAVSRYALPVTATYTAGICLLCGLWQQQLWLQFAALAFSTYLMVLANNQHGLIRIYSRMVSCAYLMLWMAACYLFPSAEAGLIAVCFAAFHTILFHAYQDKQAMGTVYYAFCFIGIASLPFVQALWLVPVLWVLLTTKVLAMSGKTFAASLLGILTPYWIGGTYYIYRYGLQAVADHFAALARFSPLCQIGSLTLPQLLTLSLVAILGMVGIVHFLRTSYRDKIRTRMIYEYLMVLEAALVVYIVLQPQFADQLLPALIVTTAPLIGHYAALSEGRMANIAFIAIVALLVSMACLHLMPC
ncbi:MAG: hypothetical protein ACI3YX_03705 [Prevotella sp.]